MQGVPDADAWAEDFWRTHERRFRPWYLAQKQPDDLVVSASPEFLLAPACRRLGIRPPIASRVDARTGRYTGLNCKGAEKVSRFREQYPDAEIGQFYSDSRSDAPLAHLARRAFLRPGRFLHLMGGVRLRSRAAAADIFSTTKARPEQANRPIQGALFRFDVSASRAAGQSLPREAPVAARPAGTPSARPPCTTRSAGAGSRVMAGPCTGRGCCTRGIRPCCAASMAARRRASLRFLRCALTYAT